MTTLYDVLTELWSKGSPKPRPKPEPLRVVRWDRLSNVHTAFCEVSIKTIVGFINQSRRYNAQLVAGFNKEKRCAEIYECDSSVLVAEIKMDGSDGFPDYIKVINYALESHEVEFFRAVRDSRSCFKDWKFHFSCENV